jgi:hypothetical protein
MSKYQLLLLINLSEDKFWLSKNSNGIETRSLNAMQKKGWTQLSKDGKEWSMTAKGVEALNSRVGLY